MSPRQLYELVPVSVKPEEDGRYFVINSDGKRSMRTFNSSGMWVDFNGVAWYEVKPTYYLRPVPSASVEGKERESDEFKEQVDEAAEAFLERVNPLLEKISKDFHIPINTLESWTYNDFHSGYLAGHAAALASSPAPAQVIEHLGSLRDYINNRDLGQDGNAHNNMLAGVSYQLSEIIKQHKSQPAPVQVGVLTIDQAWEDYYRGWQSSGGQGTIDEYDFRAGFQAAPSADAGKCAGVWRDALPLPKYPGDKHWRDCIIDSPLTWEEADKRISNGMPETVQWLESAPQRERV